jgi:hypothetical protein
MKRELVVLLGSVARARAKELTEANQSSASCGASGDEHGNRFLPDVGRKVAAVSYRMSRGAYRD